MTGPADVTVAIVSHGNRELVLGCLESLEQARSGGRRVEIAVLDNASEDGTPEAIRDRFPNVRLIANTTRAGFGANHNELARLTDGRYIFMLNDDTVVRPGSIDALAEFLDDHPHVGIAAPEILTATGEPYTFILRFPQLGAAARRALWPWPPIERWDGRTTRAVDWVNGCAMLVRREAFDAVDGFDEGFFMYAEEKDLCARLNSRGWTTFLVPGAAVLHYGEQSSGREPRRRRVEFARSQRRYLDKHLGRRRGQVVSSLAVVADGELWLAAEAFSRLPERLRPSRLRPEAAAQYRAQALSGIERSEDGGLREAAEAWNRAKDAPPATR